MTRADGGYATILVTVLMGSLSLIAIAWLNLSSAEGRRAISLSERIATDYAVEGVFYTTLADVINHRTGEGSRATSLRAEARDGHVIVSVTSLAEQIDINRSSIDEVKARITEIITEPALAAEITDVIRKQSDTSESTIGKLDTLGSGVAFERALPCLREALTVFHNAAPPSRRNGDDSLRDGSLVRIRVHTVDGFASRGVEGTVLLTGDRSDPAWVMDWRRYSDFDAEECEHEH